MFSKVLIANRGEIAVRIARTCTEVGVTPVAVFSDPDAQARHVAACGEAVHLPGRTPADTYLDGARIVAAARSTGAEAVHPGYGFLAESAAFAQLVMDAGLAWVGPPPEVTRRLGDKIAARNIAREAGVPVVPGLYEAVSEAGAVRAFAAEHGFPVAVKAAGGGGGRGLRVARSEEDVEEAFEGAAREAEAYFGSGTVYVERYLDSPKHLEVQILAPGPDHALWLGVRDCSLQRRRQKLIEETPPPRWADRAPYLGAAAVALSKAAGYVNAGTAEFLVDDDGAFYFLEVNARLQVEHTVTEEVYGVDLVACQLRIAAGERIDLAQADLAPRGHSIECRINAEDPSRDFAPTPGRITRLVAPEGPGVRFDLGYGSGDEVPQEYDSLLGKLIVTGADREDARRRMLDALDATVIEGIASTIPAHRALLEEPSFVAGTHTTTTVESSSVLDALVGAGPEAPPGSLLVAGRPARLWHPSMAAAAVAAVGGAATGEVVAPMQGTILKVLVDEGDRVEAGRPLVVLEAMKMETSLAAPRAGIVVELRARTGAAAGAGEVLAVVE